MGLINLILNLAGLLLWLGWRDSRADELNANPAIPFARTLRRLGSARYTRWKYLGGLLTLLLLRACIFYWIGPALKWTAHLQLGAITPSFPSEHLNWMLVYSILSFASALAVFYLTLLLLSVLNPLSTVNDPFQRFVRNSLGRVDRWPVVFRLGLPLVVAAVLWLSIGPLLSYLQLIPPVSAWGVRFRQGWLIGVGFCLVWKHVIGAILLLHFLNSYVYVGNHFILNCCGDIANRILSPLRRLPLRVGRMDFTPVFGVVLVYLAGEVIEYWLPKIYPT